MYIDDLIFFLYLCVKIKYKIMEFEGAVFRIMPATTGTSARGQWHRQDIVFEVVDGTFSRKICVTFFNKQSEVESLREGQSYKVSFNLESREYNGKWYNDIRAWRIQPSASAQGAEQGGYSEAAPSQTPPPYSAPMPSEPSYATSSSSENVDDLPF